MRAVVDTNVVLVANGSHAGVSPDCVDACIDRLESLMRSGHTVIDDAYRILGEYQNKTRPMRNKGPGDVFVRWLLRNSANRRHVEQVALTEPSQHLFDEFPDAALQRRFDAPDRVFVATAAAHPDRPPVWQATDSKWLDWWQALRAVGVRVEFLCPDDICRFYEAKFPHRTRPALP